MIRTIAITLSASALLAAPATAGTTTINVAGKSPEQVAKAVWNAAQASCRKEAVFVSMVPAHRICVVNAYRAALARSGSAELAALANVTPKS